MTDLPTKPHRKTITQTAVILNISRKTVYKYLENGKLKWAGAQVSLESIMAILNSTQREDDDSHPDNSEKSPVKSKTSSGWIREW